MGFGNIINNLRRCSGPRHERSEASSSASTSHSKKRDNDDSGDPFEKNGASIDDRVEWIRKQAGIARPRRSAPKDEESVAKRRKQADEVDRMFILKSWVDLENESARNAEAPKPPKGSGK